MYNPPGDPRFLSGPRPDSGQPYEPPPHPEYVHQAPQAFGQSPQAQYSQPSQQPQYGQHAPQAQYGQPSQQPQYGQHAPPSPQYGQHVPQAQYGQHVPPAQYGQPSQPPQYGSQPPAYGQHAPQPQPVQEVGQPWPTYGAGPSPLPPQPQSPPYGLGRAADALPNVSGMPAVFAFGFGIVAVVVALVFDVVFLKVHIPGVGGYAWYLTTALSFAGAGYLGIKWTRASQLTAMTAVVVAGVLYGLADVGLGLVLEELALGSAMFLGIQGVVIAFVCGGGGVRKALAERD